MLSSVEPVIKPRRENLAATGGPLHCTGCRSCLSTVLLFFKRFLFLEQLFAAGRGSQRRLQEAIPQNEGSSDWEESSELPSDEESLKEKGGGTRLRGGSFKSRL